MHNLAEPQVEESEGNYILEDGWSNQTNKSLSGK